MAAQIDKVISELRDMVLSGALQPGERVVELQFSARLGVSRTPLRIALTELEKEGLLERLPSRGFRVRAFTVDEIGDARWTCAACWKGMAARLLAERGARPSAGAAGASGGGRPPAAGAGAAGSPPRWTRAPGARSTGAFTRSCAKPPAIARAAVRAGTQQQDAAGRPRADAAVHALIAGNAFRTARPGRSRGCARITRREAVRAENLMREHAYRSRENKRVLLESFAARWPRGRCWRTPARE